MLKRMIVIGLLVATAACGKSPTSPTNNTTPPPDTPTMGPSNTRIQVQKLGNNEYRVWIWGNVKLGMERQIYFSENDRQNSDSLSGGQLVIRDYSCGGRSSFRAGYGDARDNSRENSPTTVFMNVNTCGKAKFELWVESFFVSQKKPDGSPKETAIQHTLMSATLHDSPGFRIDLATRSILEE
jgi:hypothetical protein